MAVAKVTKRSLLSSIIVILMMLAYTFAFCIYMFQFLKDWKGGIYYNADDVTMWITYGFTMAIFALSFITTVLAFERRELRSRVFGVPVALVGFSAILIQLLIDVVVMILAANMSFPEFAWVLLVIPEAIFFVFAVILVVIRQAYRSLVVEPIERQDRKAAYIKELRTELQMICETNDVESLDKPLFKLYEDAKYADPVSTKEVEAIEDEITQEVDLLKAALDNGEVEIIEKHIKKVSSLLKERGLRLKAGK